MSPRSFSRYSRLKWLFKPVFQCATRIIAQSQEEAERYKHITDGGVPITVSGNMKFDGLSPVTEADRQKLRLELGSPQGLILVGGSTHEGEEAPLLEVTRQLKDKGVALNLILAPRHPERFDRAAELIRQHGFRPRRFSCKETFEDGRDIYLLDAIGHLTRFYSLADLAFVGGTLVPVGGHSLVEPCAYSVPVTCGPHVHKTRDVARALVETGALTIAHNKMELEQTVSEFALNAEKRRTMGENGKVWLEKSQGAVARTLTAIEQEGVIPELVAYAEVKR
jgi:3-deoxy-D-manno-octulosonic-acid transferase